MRVCVCLYSIPLQRVFGRQTQRTHAHTHTHTHTNTHTYTHKLNALATQVARKRSKQQRVDSKFCAGKLNAPQILRARKVLSYAVSKLALEIPPHMRRAGLEQTVDYLELLCHDQLVPPGICVCDEALRYHYIRP